MQIIAVMGYLCSGKSTYAQKYPEDFANIEVSDIVKRLTKTQERVHDQSLDVKIIDELHRQIMIATETGKIGVVVTGIRQTSILNYIETMCETMDELMLHRVWLEVPDAILKARYQKRGETKDQKLSFEDVVERDNKLGLKHLREYLHIVNTHTIKNYSMYESADVNESSL